MANGRVVARIAGDTATGAFTCVIRRASFTDRSRYTVDARNDAGATAGITFSRLDAVVQTLAVSAGTSLRCSYTLPNADAPLHIDMSCDGAHFSVYERVDGPPGLVPDTTLALLRAAGAGAAAGSACSAMLFTLLWFIWLRRLRPSPLMPDAVVEAAASAAAVAHDGTPVPADVEPDEVVVDVDAPSAEAGGDPPVAGALESAESTEETDGIADTGEPAVFDSAGEPPAEDAAVADTGAAASPLRESIAVTDEPHGESEPAAAVELFDPEPPIRVTPIRRQPDTWEAAAVPARPGSAFTPPIAAFCLALAVIGGFIVAHPHVGELGAPNTVLEGSAIDVPYASSGVGSLRYVVTSTQGTTIASGPLTERSGVLHIAIPAVQHNDAYRIRLVMSGLLGDASNEATVGASALPVARVVTRTAAVPMIRSFAVSRSTVNGVPEVVAFYDVIADAGTLRLVDGRGIQYASEPLGPNGQTAIALPAGIDPATLALTLHATRNGASADARIALPGGAAGTSVAVASPPPDPGLGRTDAPPITVADRAVGGAPIRVDIVHHYPNLHVALLDAKARKIVGIDVPRRASSVSLMHPPVSTTTRMTVEATYRVRDEADTIVRPVLLIPAGG